MLIRRRRNFAYAFIAPLSSLEHWRQTEEYREHVIAGSLENRRLKIIRQAVDMRGRFSTLNQDEKLLRCGHGQKVGRRSPFQEWHQRCHRHRAARGGAAAAGVATVV